MQANILAFGYTVQLRLGSDDSHGHLHWKMQREICVGCEVIIQKGEKGDNDGQNGKLQMLQRRKSAEK